MWQSTSSLGGVQYLCLFIMRINSAAVQERPVLVKKTKFAVRVNVLNVPIMKAKHVMNICRTC